MQEILSKLGHICGNRKKKQCMFQIDDLASALLTQQMLPDCSVFPTCSLQQAAEIIGEMERSIRMWQMQDSREGATKEAAEHQ